MTEYTDERVEAMVREAVEKTERSFGGTFKRLKSENEELAREREEALARAGEEKRVLEERVAELERLAALRGDRIAELAVRSEIERQLKDKGPVPERFIDREAIVFDDDPAILAENVGRAIEEGKREFEEALAAAGIARDRERNPVNPTNPAVRDTIAGRDLKRAGARDALADMARRGLIRTP